MDREQQVMKTQYIMLPVGVKVPLNSPCLPFDVHEVIIHSLALDGPWTDAATLASCALICRDWYRMVVKLLYFRIHIFGRRSFKLLERTLKEKHALGHEVKVQSLSIHDITPDERASLAYLHTPLSSVKLCVKELLISGPHCSKGSTFPFHRRALLADLLHFKALQHLQLYHVEFQSLDDLRRILAAIPNLRSLVLREVSWKDPQAGFKPLFDTTSWQLSHISLSYCSSNFVAPVFWALPSTLSQTNRRKCELRPTLWYRDITPIIDLAKFCLGPPTKEPEVEGEEEEEAVVAESICWEWRCTTNGTSQWLLECCTDMINSLENPVYICFLLDSHTSPISVHESRRVVGIRISIEKQAEFNMHYLDKLLCEFQALTMLHINFVEPLMSWSFDTVIQQLPRWQNKVWGQRPDPPSMALSHDPPYPCCVETKNWRGRSRTLILHSLYRVKDNYLTKDLKEESIRAWEGILTAQRELVLVNPVEHQPSLLNTLDHMADVSMNSGNTNKAINYAKEAVEICRELDKRADSIYTLHLAEDLDRVATYLHGSRRFVEVVSYCREAVGAWRKLATLHNVEKHALQFAEALDRISTFRSDSQDSAYPQCRTGRTSPLPASDDPEISNCQREAVDVWRKLATQDASKYLYPFAQALNRVVNGLSRGTDLAYTIGCQVEAASTWQRLAAQDINQNGDTLTLILHGMAETHRRLRDCAASIKCQIEAVDVWRDAAARNPDKYYPHLASTLAKTANWASRNKLHAAALDCLRGATTIWRKLVAEDIDKYGNTLSLAFHRMSDIYLQHHDSSAAMKCRIEAVDVWRNPAAQNPDKYSHHLARAWGEMAHWASQNQFHVQAIDCRREVVDIWRNLAASNADKYTYLLTEALHIMSGALPRHPEPTAAIKYRLEVVDVWRSLATWNPDEHAPHLAQVLEDMGDWASQNQLHAKALGCWHEAVEVWQKLAIFDVGMYISPITRTLHKMADVLIQQADYEAAYKCQLEALDCWRKLAAQDSRNHPFHLSYALEEMACWASQNQLHKEAIDYRREAADIREKNPENVETK